MSKDPAFLFYPGDWMGGTQWMTFEEKGCYMELLILQYNTSKFTEAQAKQVLSICFANVWANIKQKFVFDGEYYFNARLKEEIEKRKNFSESRRKNALSPKKNTEAYAKHMENENENEIINKDKDGNIIKYPDLENVKSFFKENGYTEEGAVNCFEYYTGNKWKDRDGKIVINWKSKIRNNWFTDKYKVREVKRTAFGEVEI